MSFKNAFLKKPLLFACIFSLAVTTFYTVFTSPSLLPAASGARTPHSDTLQSSNGIMLEGAPVNINTAGVEQLMQLPGIGQVRAQAIIDYRENEGLFECAEDIMNVQGIGEAVFSGLHLYICVE